MSVANDALLLALGQNGFTVLDDQVANATTQATASRCTGQVTRFIVVAASGAAVLPSLNSLEANSIVFVINDGANALATFPFSGETRNGTLNSSLSIPAGQSGIFIKVTGSSVGKGGGQGTGTTNDWRSAVIP